jgi:hypothetical protein
LSSLSRQKIETFLASNLEGFEANWNLILVADGSKNVLRSKFHDRIHRVSLATACLSKHEESPKLTAEGM